MLREAKYADARALFLLLASFSFCVSQPCPISAADTQSRSVILSTTTSTQDTGLLDVLIPLFEQKSGYTIKVISVGTGQALALAAKGDADVALVHAPSLEKQYVAEGRLLNRRLVMYNDFVIIGPNDDPANIKSTKMAREAIRKSPILSHASCHGATTPARTLLKKHCGKQRE